MEDFGAWITILFSTRNPAIILDDIIICVGNLMNMSASQFPVLYSNDLHIQIILLLLFVNCTDFQVESELNRVARVLFHGPRI